MSILSPSQLETLDYRSILWETIVNKNFDIIDYKLQKIDRLLDVDASPGKKRTGVVLMWNGTKFVPAKVTRR